MLGVVILVACVAFILGIPATLLTIMHRKQKRARNAIQASWSGVVTRIETRTMTVGGPNLSRRAEYLRLHYRTSDGREGHVDVDTPDSAGAVIVGTLAPPPPDGYHNEVQALRVGDALVKDPGSYYPRRA